MASRAAYDLLVVGGGVMGLSLAREAARRGAVSVGLLEQFDTIMHNKGSSHGDGRIFRLAYQHPLYVAMAKMAWKGWTSLQQEAPEPILHRGGGVDVFDSMPSSARSATTRALEENGAQYEEMSPLDLHRRFPQFSIQDPMCAIFQPDAAVLFADKCRAALAHSAEVHGARIHTDTRVTMLQPHAGGVTVHSSKGVFEARKLALCAGPWTNDLLKQLMKPIPYQVSEEAVFYFNPSAGTVVDHTFRGMPTFIFWIDNGLGEHGYYGLPEVDIPGVKAAAHHCGPHIQPSQRGNEAGASRLRQVQDSTAHLIRRYFPYLSPSHTHTYTCLYSTTPDHDFVIDRVHPNVVLAAGFSGHGFKFGPAIGALVADLALDVRTQLPIDRFSINRF